MKRLVLLLAIICILLSGCGKPEPSCDLAATTLPVWEFTTRLCQGTGLTVARLVTENVSCLHDYSLKVDQVRATEGAKTVILSGAGLEDFMSDILEGKDVIDSSAGITLQECHQEGHEGHRHEADSHIWLSVDNVRAMVKNICTGLTARYPAYTATFESNLATLLADMDKLELYASTQLSALSCRELITFHDGFSYLADSFGLTILKAIEEESGSEASAAELKELCHLVESHRLTAIFTERNGSASAAGIISAETGANIYTLDMAMSGESWFTAMYHNINTLKEALE